MPNHEAHMKITLLITSTDDGAHASAHLNDESALADVLDRIRDEARYRKAYAAALASGLPTTLKDALRVLNDNPGPGFSLGSYTHVSHDDLPLVPLADFLRVVEALRDLILLAASAEWPPTFDPDAAVPIPAEPRELRIARTTLDSVAAFIPLARREVV
jgi:hypothetical protein